MSDQHPKTRAERREEQRTNRKDFESLVKGIKQALDERPDGDFKEALMTALGHLEMTEHDNNLIAAQLIEGCMACAERGDNNSARLLLYVSGAIIDGNLTVIALQRLMTIGA